MKYTLALLVCLFCSSLTTWGQYATNYQFGVTDLTAQATSGANVWHQAGPLLYPQNGSIGSDMTMRWRKTDNSLWKFDVPSQTWSAAPENDGLTKQIVVQNATTIYRLKTTDPSCVAGLNYRPQTWNGTAWINLSSSADCKTFLAVGSEGTLMGFIHGNVNGDLVYQWNGSSWNSFGTVNLLNISVADANTMCGMGKGTNGVAKIYWLSSGIFTLMSPQPPGRPAGCAMAHDPNEANVLFAWNTAGTVSRFDFTTATWQTVTTPNVGGAYVTQVIAGSKLSAFMTMAGGAGGGGVYHYNVYAGFVMGTTSGTFNNCVNQACTITTKHNGTLQVRLPHGMAGALGSVSVNATDFLSVSSYDFSPFCDPFFGDPRDPECQGLATGNVLCTASGAFFQGDGAPQPPNIPDPGHFSEYVGSFTGLTPVTNWTRQVNTKLALASITCDATTNTCGQVPTITVAVCRPPAIQGTVTEGGAAIGDGVTTQDAINAARAGCARHSTTLRKPGAWGIFSNYHIIPGQEIPACTPITATDAIPYITPCY